MQQQRLVRHELHEVLPAVDWQDPGAWGEGGDVGAPAAQSELRAVGGGPKRVERRREQWRAYYQRNKAVIAAKRKDKYRSDLDTARANNRAEYKNNADKRRQSKMRYVEANREAINAKKRATRAAAAEPSTDYLKRFGLTKADYDRMLVAQQGLCAICSKPEVTRRLAVDHSHSTGRVRGLLCGKCNTALGQMNDDPAMLLRAVEYLRRSCG